ncbi:hypothetical protein [Peribacillus huizhouensis]|uniref:Uncharacterized protein n=1 Tax=Peribacillus huizhouensis TaxID=1501239 RepID=A0ABR6CPF2_9BACI|nr:hypothetical protein [Peribacillus huizhouensis]MBA9026917.1 hypothetical protein [Peribacillus huizhouensis]
MTNPMIPAMIMVVNIFPLIAMISKTNGKIKKEAVITKGPDPATTIYRL